jgi:hypothetical protein
VLLANGSTVILSGDVARELRTRHGRTSPIFANPKTGIKTAVKSELKFKVVSSSLNDIGDLVFMEPVLATDYRWFRHREAFQNGCEQVPRYKIGAKRPDSLAVGPTGVGAFAIFFESDPPALNQRKADVAHPGLSSL